MSRAEKILDVVGDWVPILLIAAMVVLLCSAARCSIRITIDDVPREVQDER